MRTSTTLGLVLLLASAGTTMGQTGAPAPPVQVVTNPPRPPMTLWGFLGLSEDRIGRCCARFRRSQAGKLLTNLTKPVGLITGGVIGPSPGSSPVPPPPPASSGPPAGGVTPAGGSADGGVVRAADAAPGNGGSAGSDPAAGPKAIQSASAKIKAYQAEAAATVAAIDELATLDCNYWPEAKKALITALRVNRIECVRLAAARALGRGCCCNKDTIDALRIAVSGSVEDGNPAESSMRVKAAAFTALQHCLSRPDPIPPGTSDALPDLAPIEAPVPASYPVTRPVGARRVEGNRYEARLRARSDRQVLADAWRTLAVLSRSAETTRPSGDRLDTASDRLAR